MPPCRHFLLRAASLLALFFALAGPARAVVVDAPSAIAALLTPHLPKKTPADPAAREDLRRRLEKELPELLATEGYFQPHIDFADQDGELRIHIDPGRRTFIADVHIDIAGPVDEKLRQSLVTGWRLPVGTPFRQAAWSAAKQQLLAALWGAGHAAADLTDSLADIDPEAAEAHLTLTYDAGPPYRFGELQIEGLSRYSPQLVSRYNRTVHPGDPYREENLAAFQNALQSTPYFASVQVELEKGGDPGPDGVVTAPVRVLLRERPPHRIGLGAGYSSNTGARVETTYYTADFLRNAWELNNGIRLEQKQQTAYADIFLPPEPESHYRYSFGGLVQHTDIQGLATERYALGAQQVQQRGSLEVRLGLNWQQERKRPEGIPPTVNRALVPDSTWTWRHVDSLLEPRRGIVLQAQIGGGSHAVLSDRDFVRLHGRYQQFIPLSRQDILTLRAEGGYTIAQSRQGIPQDYLFRAGGTNSVRGYAYQSLGVQEGGAIVGGRYLATASVEVTHWLNERWGAAAFVDGGNAGDDPASLHPVLGYGFGARWKSPAGPIAVDLAYGEKDNKLQLHFSLAIPF